MASGESPQCGVGDVSPARDAFIHAPRPHGTCNLARLAQTSAVRITDLTKPPQSLAHA